MNASIITPNGTINAVINSKTYSISPGALYYNDALKAAKIRDFKALLAAFDLDSSLKDKSGGKVTFENGVIRYNGAAVDNKLSKHIIRMVGEGFDCGPIMRFMELCYLNPNRTVIDRLYDFMINNCIMLGDNGYVVGYKGVRPTGYDWYSNTVLYEAGKTSSIPRENCDEDSTHVCSTGLHLGNLSYARGWVREGKLILCQINPKNVTAIPEEVGFPKLRCCSMDVLEDVSYLKIEGDYQENLIYKSNHDKGNNTKARDKLGRFTGGFSPQPRDSNGKFVKKS